MHERNVFNPDIVTDLLEDAYAVMTERDTDYTGPVTKPYFGDAWVQPDGAFRYVPHQRHETVARHITGGTTLYAADQLESMGWLHVSIGEEYGGPYVNVFTNKKPTQAQLNTLFDILMAAPPLDDVRTMFIKAVRRHVPDFMEVEG